MKLKNNQSGIAHVIVIVLIVFVLGIIGFVGWKVWDTSKKDEPNKEASSYSTTNETNKEEEKENTESMNKSGPGIKIPELGIKINDPENRGLALEQSEICEVSCAKVDLIRDNNEDYFKECEYVASIREIVNKDNPLADMKTTDYYYPLTKKVGSKWYQVRTGTNFQQNCKYNSDGTNPNEVYEKDIRLYIANNIVEL